MNTLDSLDPRIVGERLRIAREAAGLTQKEAADLIEVARTTLVAVEKGERRVRFNELQGLAKIYGTSINTMLRSEAVQVELAPRFRKLEETADTAVEHAVQVLTNFVKAEIELENILGVKRSKNYPPERPLLPGDVSKQADRDAQELRERLGLGNRPISDIVTLLEMEFDVRVYVWKIHAKISGLFAFDDAVGPCILLNANHPISRRVQTAAHECGHLISSRRQPEIFIEEEKSNSREERYADAFGRALLTPARAISQMFRDVTAGSERLTRRHIIILSHYFSVSREAMVRRLEELGLVSGVWDWFVANGGITDEQAKQVLGDLRIVDKQSSEWDRPTTLRLSMLAEQAYKKELLSEGQLARLLCINRVELRHILSGIDMEGNSFDDAPILR